MLPIVIAVVGGLVLGLVFVAASPIAVFLLIALGFFLGIAYKHPELFIVSLVLATSTAIPFEDIPVIASIGPGRIFVTDLVLLIPFGLMMLRLLAERDYTLLSSPLDLPLMLFVLVALIATWLGFSREMSQMSISKVFSSPPMIIRLAIPEIRCIAYYLIFFSATNIVRSEKQLSWLLAGLYMGALIAAALIILQVAFPGVELVRVGRVESLLTEGVRYKDVTRVADLPGEGLILIMFSVVLANLLHLRPTRIRDWVLFVPLGMALLFTYNRNFWASLALSAMILAYLGNRAGWQRFTIYGMAGALLVAVVVMISLSMPESKVAQVAQAAGDRFISLVKSDTYTEGNSFQFRIIEADYAIQQLENRPVFGVGLGAYYRPYDNRLDWQYFDGRGYIHNGHFFVMLKSGLLGYLCFVLISIIFVVRGFRHWHVVKEPQFRAVLLGFVTAYLGIAIAAFVNPIYMQANWAPVLGLMWGINEVILRFNNVDNKKKPSTNRNLWYIYNVKQEKAEI
ncbi:MAG: O-antigen ligase family protein [Anaerolineae bacterium]|nr:O-antigen ligase family protein [Anaerolineae bacterium]